MPSDSVSYNPILFVADGQPYDSRKLQNGRPKQRKKGGRRGGGKNTDFGNPASLQLLLQRRGIKKQGGFERVNHLLEAVNSQGRRGESEECVSVSSAGITATLHRNTKTWLLSVHTFPQTMEKCRAFEVQIKRIHQLLR